ncbi:metal-dependent hydrolase [Octadecabacter sp.]|nr:metal-dependent hydrolase [Octadecabacter sp.]
MITAHLPSGYVVGRLWAKAPLVLPAAVLGGILPDFDMIWFYLIDDRAFHHHRYWVHIPAFWAAIAVIALPLVTVCARHYLTAACAFFAALLTHVCLDTIAGDIMWHWPWSTKFTHLVTIPARYESWVLNFVLHPVFVLELLIWAAAIFLFWKRT